VIDLILEQGSGMQVVKCARQLSPGDQVVSLIPKAGATAGQ
jgi:hypothetical protein